MRVAVSQFATSLNVQQNLASCIHMINETAVYKPSLIVLPEFCNTLFCQTQPDRVINEFRYCRTIRNVRFADA